MRKAKNLDLMIYACYRHKMHMLLQRREMVESSNLVPLFKI